MLRKAFISKHPASMWWACYANPLHRIPKIAVCDGLSWLLPNVYVVVVCYHTFGKYDLMNFWHASRWRTVNWTIYVLTRCWMTFKSGLHLKVEYVPQKSHTHNRNKAIKHIHVCDGETGYHLFIQLLHLFTRKKQINSDFT